MVLSWILILLYMQEYYRASLTGLVFSNSSSVGSAAQALGPTAHFGTSSGLLNTIYKVTTLSEDDAQSLSESSAISGLGSENPIASLQSTQVAAAAVLSSTTVGKSATSTGISPNDGFQSISCTMPTKSDFPTSQAPLTIVTSVSGKPTWTKTDWNASTLATERGSMFSASRAPQLNTFVTASTGLSS